MNPKITAILITLIILLGLAAAGFLIYKNLIKPAMEKGSVATLPLGNEEETLEIKNEETLQETALVKDDFTIVLPAGWQEVPDAAGVLVMAADAREEITDAKLKELGFRTNLSVKSDDMSKYSEIQGIQDYVASIKASLIQLIPGIEFTVEKEDTVNDRGAIFIECTSRQEDIDFKTLLVFIEGNDQAVWAISFNTLQDSWPAYQGLFYRTAQSFKLK